MNKYIKMLFFVIMLIFNIKGQINKQNNTDSLQTKLQINNAFNVGEHLEFNIKYGFIKAGTATMGVESEIEINSRNCYLIKTTARSAKSFDWFYKVRDTVTTYLDTKKFHSLKFSKRLREGDYYYDLNAEYDQQNGKAYVEKTRYYDENAKK